MALTTSAPDLGLTAFARHNSLLGSTTRPFTTWPFSQAEPRRDRAAEALPRSTTPQASATGLRRLRPSVRYAQDVPLAVVDRWRASSDAHNDRLACKEEIRMHLVHIGNKPFAVINGKDYAIYRWFDAGRAGPLFIQVAGRTPLQKEDLPNDDWVVSQAREGSSRVTTAWRHPWFDYREDASRRLAFLGASTTGSLFLAFRYLAARFGLVVSESRLVSRAAEVAASWSAPYVWTLEKVADTGLSEHQLVLVDLASSLDGERAASLLGLDAAPA